MQRLFPFLILFSFLFACLTQKMDALSQAVLTGCSNGVSLCLTLLGSMGLWSGIMQIAKDSGLADAISRRMIKPLSLLFGGLKDRSALNLISLNLSANLLGLSNAATPAGLAAMKRLDELNHHAETPSFAMQMLAGINTASIQLIPASVIFLRSKHGSSFPFSILPAVFLTSFCSLAAVILLIHLFCQQKRQNK